MDTLREHLIREHGRWCGELVGIDETALHDLHELEHYEAGIGLLRVGLRWVGLRWAGLRWANGQWTGLRWAGLRWAGLRWTGRDNARTPVQWTPGPHAGFSTGTPWIPVNPNHEVVNAEAARADPDSVFHHYRRLIELRHTEPVVALGDFTMLVPDHEQVYAFTRRLGQVELLVLANVSGDEVRAHLPDGWAGAEVLLTNRPGAPAPADITALAPWEARVHRRIHGNR